MAGGARVVTPAPPVPPENLASKDISDESLPHAPRARRWPLFLRIAVVLLLALGLWFQSYRSRLRPLLPEGKVMLAVLPSQTRWRQKQIFDDGLPKK